MCVCVCVRTQTRSHNPLLLLLLLLLPTPSISVRCCYSPAVSSTAAAVPTAAADAPAATADADAGGCGGGGPAATATAAGFIEPGDSVCTALLVEWCDMGSLAAAMAGRVFPHCYCLGSSSPGGPQQQQPATVDMLVRGPLHSTRDGAEGARS